MPIAHDHTMAVLVPLLSEGRHVRVDLGLEGCVQHPPRPLGHQLVQRDRQAHRLARPPESGFTPYPLGPLTVQIVKWPSSLAVLKKTSNFGNLCSYRLSEPPSGHQVVESPKNSMSKIKFLDVSNTNTLRHVFNFKPCVEAPRNTVLKGHVYVVRPVPSVSGDHRSFEATEKLAVLAGQHAVGNIGELGYPNHLRISLGVLSRVKNEIECLDGTNSPGHCDALASDHGCLQMKFTKDGRNEGYFLFHVTALLTQWRRLDTTLMTRATITAPNKYERRA